MAGMCILVADTPEPDNRPQRHAEGKVGGTVSKHTRQASDDTTVYGNRVSASKVRVVVKEVSYVLPTGMDIEACIGGYIPLSFYRLYSCTVDRRDVTKAYVLLQYQTASISHHQDSTTECSSRTCTA